MQYIKIYLLLVFVLLLQTTSVAQVEKSQKGTYALTNASIVTVTKGTVEGTLLIQDGKIAAIGANVSIPSGATTIDCSDYFIYPGLIDGGTTLGLSEVGSISLTQDANEIGEFTPHMQALTAVNPNSVSIPVTRVEGVTTVLTKPTGGTFPGTAALINLVGYTPDQMYAGFKGVIMNYPSSGRSSRWDRRSDEDRKKEEEKKLKKINDAWDKLVLYAEIQKKAKDEMSMAYNPEMDAMLPLLSGEGTLLLEVNKDKDILSALKWVKEKEIQKVVLTGVAEGWRVADSIAQAGIPVITGPMLSTPRRLSDRYDVSYTNAGKMLQAGVKVAIRTNEAENVRNLPFNAGFAAAYGMGKEEALKAVTIVPAEIFGISDQLGSLEVGKNATLFVSDGDPFETKTDVKYLFINGWQIAIDSRHIQLYEEFLDRSPGLKKE
ncbi:MAG: amidohydrolase family protein [Bacteroidota bacterium]